MVANAEKDQKPKTHKSERQGKGKAALINGKTKPPMRSATINCLLRNGTDHSFFERNSMTDDVKVQKNQPSKECMPWVSWISFLEIRVDQR